MRWVPDNHKFTVTTIIKSLSDMDIAEINAILSIVTIIQNDEKLNVSDDTIYSYYKAELETLGADKDAKN